MPDKVTGGSHVSCALDAANYLTDSFAMLRRSVLSSRDPGRLI